MKQLVFATGNEGKMKEIRMILSDLPYEILSLSDLNLEIEIIEDGLTFEENALKKAVLVQQAVPQLFVLADDSGLEIDYLGKAPGIYSARYLGEGTSYDCKNRYILDQLEGVPKEKRTARFVCVIACAFPNGKTATRKAAIEGMIGYEIAGKQGFGYDPIFYLEEYGCTTAELSPEQKNKISHRGKALEMMKEVLASEDIGGERYTWKV